MQHYSRCLSRWLWLGSLVTLLSLSTCVRGAGALPISAYPGEYVVTVPAQSVKRSEGFVGQASARGISPLDDSATTLRQLGPRTALVSTNRLSSAHGLQIGPRTLGLQELQDDDRFCKDLLASGVVDSCTPNYQLSTQQLGAPDPRMTELWGLSDEAGVAAPRAWEITTGSVDVVVAVIDTGVDYNHPDLAQNIWVNPGEISANGIDDDGNGYVDDIHGVNTSVWATNRADPLDDNKHGTHVAGTIGALHTNGIGVGGVSPHVTLLPIKFMDSSGSGRLSDAIAAIDYMIDLKVNRGINIRVANNSWGGGAYSPALRNAIERARDAGIIFVVAAGNSGEDIDLFPAYPASYEVSNVLSVAAIDRNQNLASFSNYAAEAVDIAAPGAEVVSTLPNGEYGALSGTSMATPHVVGSLALLLANEPALSVEQAIARVLESGRELPALKGADGTFSLVRSGRGVDVGKMVRNETAPLPKPDGGLPACGYTFETAKIEDGIGLDKTADRQMVVHQVDEGDYYRVELPFDFPFFRTTTRTLFISPNGLVYLNEPKTPDYQVAPRAPNNSIAAFHTDLTPRKAHQGVRVFSDSEHLTVLWSSEQYSLAEQGPVAVRLSLYRNGLIVSSISFESMQDPVLASRTLLGDSFATPPVAPLGLIGVSATSARVSSTLDVAAAQGALIAGSDQRLDLRVAMIPNCFTIPEVETRLVPPHLESIKLALSRNGKVVAATFLGKGNGVVAVSGSVNGRLCPQAGQALLVDGLAKARLLLPRGVNKVTLRAQSVRRSISSRGKRVRSARDAHVKNCARVMRSLQ
jgi:subtilisin family serine protease